MPWYQSFENVSKLLILGAGLVLLFTGQTEIGMALLGSSGFLMAAKAADNKKSNGKAAGAILLFCCLIFATGGCQMMQNLPGEVVALNLQVYDIHDDYVQNDPELNEFDREQLLRSTALLRQIMLLLQGGATSIDFLLLQQGQAPSE